VCWLVFAATSARVLAAQDEARATRDVPFARVPDGRVLGTLRTGAEVAVGRSRGGWTEVTLKGWIIETSLGRDVRDGFEIGVSAERGENLRAEPNGPVRARLRYGALLERTGARGRWVQVRRTGWVPRTAVERVVETASVRREQQGARGSRREPGGTGGNTQERGRTDATRRERTGTRNTPVPEANRRAVPNDSGAPTPSPDSARPSPSLPASSRPLEDSRIQVTRSTPFHGAPEAAELGTLQPGVNGRVLGRAGEWVRIQLEGWVRSGDVGPADDGALIGVSAAELRAEPARYQDQLVEWRLQYIAVQEADELRSELPAGRPFLLTRGPLPEPGFVYVILPRAQAERFRSLPALQELVVHVRIKAPRTRYLTTPVVELSTVVSGLPR
jgi:hypothetical protein